MITITARCLLLHAELNNMGPDDFPSMCTNVAFQHIKGGEYERDLNASLLIIERYFDSLLPLGDGLDAVLMDIDDIFPSNIHYASLLMNRVHDNGCIDCFSRGKASEANTVSRFIHKTSS
ncbi:hypothetical protein OIU77_013579 [Salix suchowensis]|uniref:Uncharacterized protein n=1 Tax=Salix suchowensis TaxID=1278906 RepID=A0ABQ8ZV18_9ROSI|nr:hypothetical protein OIU77_013579 [Salix suchowensis]